MVLAGNYNGDLAFPRCRGTLQSGLPQEIHEHQRETAQTIEAHQNTVRVISLRLSLHAHAHAHAHAHLTLHSCVNVLVLASKQETASEDTHRLCFVKGKGQIYGNLSSLLQWNVKKKC